jgi:hypothetical protein
LILSNFKMDCATFVAECISCVVAACYWVTNSDGSSLCVTHPPTSGHFSIIGPGNWRLCPPPVLSHSTFSFLWNFYGMFTDLSIAHNLSNVFVTTITIKLPYIRYRNFSLVRIQCIPDLFGCEKGLAALLSAYPVSMDIE